MNFNGSIADDADACDNHYGSDSSSSSESEGWLTRCNVSSDDDDCPPAEMATADVIDPIRLPPDERFSYMIQGVPGMQLTVQCSNATVGIYDKAQAWSASIAWHQSTHVAHASSGRTWRCRATGGALASISGRGHAVMGSISSRSCSVAIKLVTLGSTSFMVHGSTHRQMIRP